MKQKNRKEKSIRLQISAASMSFALLLAVLVAGISYFFFQHFLLRSQRQAVQSSLQLMGNDLNSDISPFIMLTNWCTIDENLAEYLEVMSGQRALGSSYVNERQLAIHAWNNFSRQTLQNLSTDYLLRCVVSTPDGSHFLQVQPSPSGDKGRISQSIINAPFFHSLLDAKRCIWLGPVENPGGSDVSTVLPILRPIYRNIQGSRIGFVYLEINPALITDRLKNYAAASDSILYISFSEDHVFRCSDGELIPAQLPRTNQVSYHLRDIPWTITQTLSHQELRLQRYIYMGLLLSAMLMIILSAFLLKLYLDRIILSPITKLLYRLKRIGQGDLSRDDEITWPNEFGRIGNGINSLAANVKELLDRKVRDEKKQQELKYQILRSQINPHFLYNTLNSIKWMARIQGADGIDEMTTALARLLKTVSKGTRDMIPLQMELDTLKDYFTIMRFRYGGSLELNVELREDRLREALLHRFSLQPLVENAIFHGIEPKGAPGVIEISIWSEDKRLLIDVRDNGIGISAEKIKELLRKQPKKGKQDFFANLGIYIVQQRIQLAFGKNYGIQIESEENVYSCMHLTLPLRFSDSDENNC